MVRAAALVCLLLAASAAAGAEVPQFFLEAIEVSNVRYVSRYIILAESRLQSGQSYGEVQLADAARRLNRLPFVRHAEFRLVKGSARDRYILRIEIDETRPLFYNIGYARRTFDAELGPSETVVDEEGALGERWFLGRRTEAHAWLDPARANRAQVGLTSYGIFGTSASVSFLVGYEERVFRVPEQIDVVGRFHTSDDLTYSIIGAIPLHGDHSLRASLEQRTGVSPFADFSEQPFRLLIRKFARREGELSWVYDTTDDALFPTSGTLATAGAQWTTNPRFDERTALDPQLRVETHQDLAAGVVSHRLITPRQSVSLGAEVLTILDRRDRSYSIEGGYSSSALRERLRFADDLRAGVRARLTHNVASSSTRANVGTLAGWIAWRNAWGVMRIGAEYVWHRGMD